MTKTTIEQSAEEQGQTKATETLRDKNELMLCGPGCSCGANPKNSKQKIVVMLLVLTAVAIALVFRNFF